ncbi:MAG: pyridoxamine 5'-phosphate oxidase family protein [Desulfobacterales bacterium]|jgi:nitroimidazol reductase NimA-like FMN-containing flavoprotein (pyridoxamine 5'-phosphate oxidase superfamily)
MLKKMKALAREKNICVLATITGSKPYCSLMAYVTNEECTEIYMVTQRQTQKYQNLIANPAVSLLIDTRDTSPRSAARAMTVEGIFQKIKDPAKEKKVRRELLSAHPHLNEFMRLPEAEVIQIKIKSFLLLDGLTQASFEDVQDIVS